MIYKTPNTMFIFKNKAGVGVFLFFALIFCYSCFWCIYLHDFSMLIQNIKKWKD